MRSIHIALLSLLAWLLIPSSVVTPPVSSADEDVDAIASATLAADHAALLDALQEPIMPDGLPAGFETVRDVRSIDPVTDDAIGAVRQLVEYTPDHSPGASGSASVFYAVADGEIPESFLEATKAEHFKRAPEGAAPEVNTVTVAGIEALLLTYRHLTVDEYASAIVYAQVSMPVGSVLVSARVITYVTYPDSVAWDAIGDNSIHAEALLLTSISHLGSVTEQTPGAETTTTQGLPSQSDETADRFNALARSMPELAIGSTEGTAYFAYADLAMQAHVVGAEPPAPDDEEGFGEWLQYFRRMPVPYTKYDYQMMPDFRTTFGFDYRDVDQVLSTISGDMHIELYRGRFDEEAMHSAWEAAGYHRAQIGNITVFVFHGDAYIDWESPVSQYGGLGHSNYATILQDGTLVFANSQAAMEQVASTSHGEAPSLADNADVRALLDAARPDLASIVLIRDPGYGSVGPCCNPNVPPAEMREEQRQLNELTAQYGPMPPWEMALLGETAGIHSQDSDEPLDDAPRSSLQIALMFGDRDSAAAAAQIVSERIGIMWSATARVPYTRFVQSVSGRVVDNAPVATIDMEQAEPRMGWLTDSMLSKDLRYLLYGEDD